MERRLKLAVLGVWLAISVLLLAALVAVVVIKAQERAASRRAAAEAARLRVDQTLRDARAAMAESEALRRQVAQESDQTAATKKKLSGTTEGMTQGQVESIWGKPDELDTSPFGKRCTYRLPDGGRVIFEFSEGRLTGIKKWAS
jgi:hypothetical protein